MGASEAVYQLLDHEVVFEGISPIMLMRSVKNKIEREGMRNAHIKDAVAVIETLNYLKERVRRVVNLILNLINKLAFKCS